MLQTAQIKDDPLVRMQVTTITVKVVPTLVVNAIETNHYLKRVVTKNYWGD